MTDTEHLITHDWECVCTTCLRELEAYRLTTGTYGGQAEPDATDR